MWRIIYLLWKQKLKKEKLHSFVVSNPSELCLSLLQPQQHLFCYVVLNIEEALTLPYKIPLRNKNKPGLERFCYLK